jgi:vitamin B12 transporter
MVHRSIPRARLLATLAFACAFAPVPVAGQTPAKLEPVAVTAARDAQPIADVLADVTVIGPDEIARAGVQSLAELLQRQHGVEIVQNGGPGSVSGVFLRGANRGQTLVLIDGVRIASASAGATSLEAIPLDQIERIEILRGPASSLYGADAIGGVVQVFTRRGSGAFSANASAEYGTYRTWDAKAGASGSAGPLQYSAQVGGKASRGFNTIANPANFLYNPDPDGYSNRSASASLGYEFAADQALTAQYLGSRLDNQFDGGPEYDDRTVTVAQAWQVASRNRLASFWVSRLAYGEGIDDSRTETAFGASTFDTTQRQLGWQNDFTLPLGGLSAGYERREERLATDAAFAATARDTDSLFGIYRLSLDGHALQANLRHDRSTQYGGRTTGAVAYGYRFSPAWRATAGYSTGFKPPSFNDLYYPGFSNADLEPETSRNIEAAVYWNGEFERATVEASAIAYRNRVSQLIVLQCDAAFNCVPYNVDRATLEGVTLGVDVRGDDGLALTASLDLASPENDLTGKLLPRRARRHGAVTAGIPVGPARLGVELVVSSLRYDDPANLVTMGGYAIVNLTFEWALSPRLTLFARGDNVFGKNYELAAGYATGGATVLGGIRLSLR